MTATNSEHRTNAGPDPGLKIVKVKKVKKPAPADVDLPCGGSAANWNEAARRALALRLMEQLDDNVVLASKLSADPAFCGADDRVTAILTLARMTSANAHLGRAIGHLIQVEQRRRTILQRVEAPASNDSNLKQAVSIEADLVTKMLRYLKMLADETLVPALQEAEDIAAYQAGKSDGRPANPA